MLDKSEVMLIAFISPCILALIVMIGMLLHDGIKTYNEYGYFQIEKNTVVLEVR